MHTINIMEKTLLSIIVLISALCASAQTDIVPGGQFKDRILPMQGSMVRDSSRPVWGASGVQGRLLDNGAEPLSTLEGKAVTNYWGGNIVKDADGKYHLFVAAWDGITYSFRRWAQSDVYHLVSDNVYGPYSFTQKYLIGKGHNPTIYLTDDGTYVLYVLWNNSEVSSFQSKSLDGPWKGVPLEFNLRDRNLNGGKAGYSNCTFCRRDDGSFLCISRGGVIWVSRDGKSPYQAICDERAYPKNIKGAFEDPVMWYDGYQYHHIVNDYKTSVAYYSRSIDGVHWICEQGRAYDPNVAVHPDGTTEKWWKFERPRIFQDDSGRAIQLNMAVLDVKKTEKDERTDGAVCTEGYDDANDIHSTKNIMMPLNPGLLLEVVNTKKITTSTSRIMVRVKAEKGFCPATDLDISSLRFGSYSTVNMGGGAQVVSTKTDGDDLILTFNGKDSGLTDDEFAPKMIGRYAAGYVNPATPTAQKGGMCFGYAKLSYISRNKAYLSPLRPQVSADSKVVAVHVDNYGLSSSDKNTKVVVTDGKRTLATGILPALAPYASEDVSLTPSSAISPDTKKLVVSFYNGKEKVEEASFAIVEKK